MRSVVIIFSLLLIGQVVDAQEMQRSKALNEQAVQATQQSAFHPEQKYILETRDLQYNNLPKVNLTVVRTQVITVPDKSLLKDFPTAFLPEVKMGMERKKALAYIFIPHYILKGNGEVEELLDYTIDLVETPVAAKTSGNRTYAAHSVLSSGNFYKIAIDQEGVYKIDYEFIANNCKIVPTSINPANIRVYGNGGQMLSESNKVIPADDLIENAIEVVDGNDGQFNPGDYILFYASGPHTLIKDSLQKGFTHAFNVYSERSYYYLNFDKGAGKRIALQSALTNPSVTVNTYNDYQFHERDSVNHGRFGKEFWGDEMSMLPGRSLSKNFSFSFPDIDETQPLILSTRTGSITHSGSSNLKINVNGIQQQNITYEPFGDAYYDPVIQIKENKTSITNPTTSVNVQCVFTPPSNDAAAYIGNIGINTRRKLVFRGQLIFADWNSVAAGNIASFNLQNANSNTKVWDITDPLNPVRMPSVLTGDVLSFNQEASKLHRFVALDGSQVSQPTYIGSQENQDLHALKNLDYIIIVHPDFKSEAERLAAHHQAKRGYQYVLVSPQEIYNEFSSGSQDVSAIRNFLKMIYDKSDANHLANSVLLFGDASYDYKNRLAGNTNYVPTHETNQSNNKILGYCSDDYYGFLDDNENINDYSGQTINTLDIGIGRLPISSLSQATKMVTKILNYDSPASFGPWKNNTTFCADNGDGARHLLDAEIVSSKLAGYDPGFNNAKLYVDAFPLQSTPAGPRTPDANVAMLANLFNGTFLVNYNGHGGPGGWCEERIFSFNDINNLKNSDKLPLFITATCDFAPFDNPNYFSAGETLVTKPDGGAIALMTTTQLVFADQNLIMDTNYISKGFIKKINNKMPTLGDGFRLSKNLRYVNYIDESTSANFRKFALLGDPGLPLSFPEYQVFTDSINGVSVNVQYDTLKALGKFTISGHVTDANGNFLPDFNGVVYPTIFDKPKKQSNLQSVGDPKIEYFVQNNAVYKGKASVKNGKFRFTFVMPKDINYEVAQGKISYYINNETVDGKGYDKNIYLGGSASNPVVDNVGPIIKPYMNDERFVNGGITPSSSKLIIKLFDDNGINYSGNSIGHDITAVLDNNPQTSYVLNSFFEADMDDYRSGVVRFPFNYLSEGEHVINIKAWDIANNSSEASIRFIVVNTKEGKLAHVLNYPNPFSTKTQFMFEHNMPGQNLNVSVQVMTATGKVVKTLRSTLNTEGTRISNIEWDGTDEYGDKLANGVYLYKVHVKSSSGLSDTQLEKLILLR